MECQEVLKSGTRDDSGGVGCRDSSELVSARDYIGESGGLVDVNENLYVDIIDDMDTYFDDINDRLVISRMVNDSIIKGIVNAVEQNAAEVCAKKDLELSNLKQSLPFFNRGRDDIEQCLIPALDCDKKEVDLKTMTESLHIFGKAAKEQFEMLKKEITVIRCFAVGRSDFDSESVQLGGLSEKQPGTWSGVEKTIDNLEKAVGSMVMWADNVLQLSSVSLTECQQEHDFEREVEAIVMKTSIRCLRDEFQTELCTQGACLCGQKSDDWLEKFNEISGLRKDLEAFLNSLPNLDPGHLQSHGSVDVDNSHGSLSSLWEGNGKGETTAAGKRGHYEAAQLCHMSKDQLVSYFNSTITTMKREHESSVQELTEKYISLKGKYLSERRHSLPPVKDKEYDILRKMIPEVILKLDDILVEREKLLTFEENVDTLGSLKERVDSLLSENQQLANALADQKNEVNHLLLQVSVASEKMMHYSLSEANLQKSIGHLYELMEDARVEASVLEEVYKCFLRELSLQIKHVSEEMDFEHGLMLEILKSMLNEADACANSTSICATDDASMELAIMQGISETLFEKTLKDVKLNFEDLLQKYLTALQSQASFERKIIEKEADLKLEIEQNERLRQEVHLISELMEEKESLARDVSAALMKEREQTQVDKMEINNLNQELDIQRSIINALTEEKHRCWPSFEAKEKEYMQKLEAVVALVGGMSTRLVDFECRVSEDFNKNNTRLEDVNSQLSFLFKAANYLKITGNMYKQRFERRCSDLEMAEAEVDLLGDEVDALLNLLEKIYIALDHYSPILQHYPGIIEILKLIKRELHGESIKKC